MAEIIVPEAFVICSSKRALVSGFSVMDATRVRVRVRMRDRVQVRFRMRDRVQVRVWAS
jgi:hypothetical protein